MLLENAAQALPPSVVGASAADAEIDYDGDYRALDLEPGAPPHEIIDRARLLLAAFDAEMAPPGLRAHTLARTQIVVRAAATLLQYWQAHGAPPPRPPNSAPLALSQRLLTPLGEALGTGDEAAPVRPADGVTVLVRPAGDTAAGAVIGPAAVRRSEAAISLAAPHPPAIGHRSALPRRRSGSMARAVLVRLMLAGLVVTAVIRVLQYRAEHLELATVGEPRPVAATGQPGESPFRWSAAPQQPTGAAIPALGGRLR